MPNETVTGRWHLSWTTFGSVPAEDVQQALRCTDYYNNRDDPTPGTRTVNVYVYGSITGYATSATSTLLASATSTVTVTGVNDKPVVTIPTSSTTFPASPRYLTDTNSDYVLPLSSLAISDVDDTYASGASVRITQTAGATHGACDIRNDQLELPSNYRGHATHAHFVGSWDQSQCLLTVKAYSSVYTPTVAELQAALREVKYKNRQGRFNPSNFVDCSGAAAACKRRLEVVVMDNGGDGISSFPAASIMVSTFVAISWNPASNAPVWVPASLYGKRNLYTEDGNTQLKSLQLASPYSSAVPAACANCGYFYQRKYVVPVRPLLTYQAYTYSFTLPNVFYPDAGSIFGNGAVYDQDGNTAIATAMKMYCSGPTGNELPCTGSTFGADNARIAVTPSTTVTQPVGYTSATGVTAPTRGQPHVTVYISDQSLVQQGEYTCYLDYKSAGIMAQFHIDIKARVCSFLASTGSSPYSTRSKTTALADTAVGYPDDDMCSTGYQAAMTALGPAGQFEIGAYTSFLTFIGAASDHQLKPRIQLAKGTAKFTLACTVCPPSLSLQVLTGAERKIVYAQAAAVLGKRLQTEGLSIYDIQAPLPTYAVTSLTLDLMGGDPVRSSVKVMAALPKSTTDRTQGWYSPDSDVVGTYLSVATTRNAATGVVTAVVTPRGGGNFYVHDLLLMTHWQ